MFKKLLLVGLVLANLACAADLEISGIAATPNLNRNGAKVRPEAFRFTRSKHIPILLDHDRSINSIVGYVTHIEVKEDGLHFVALIPDIPGNERIIQGIKAGIYRNVSVGYLTSDEIPDIKRADLVELSILSVPADPGAYIRNIKEVE